jgi:hypothetical protein
MIAVARRRDLDATATSCKTRNKLGNRTVFHRYRPETTDMLRTCLGDCPDDMEVEVRPGVPLVAKTVADLRALNAWSIQNTSCSWMDFRVCRT